MLNNYAAIACSIYIVNANINANTNGMLIAKNKRFPFHLEQCQ